MWPAVPAAISVPSTGIREEPRKSRIGYCTCKNHQTICKRAAWIAAGIPSSSKPPEGAAFCGTFFFHNLGGRPTGLLTEFLTLAAHLPTNCSKQVSANLPSAAPGDPFLPLPGFPSTSATPRGGKNTMLSFRCQSFFPGMKNILLPKQ